MLSYGNWPGRTRWPRIECKVQLHEFMKTRVVTIGPEEAASLAWSRMRGRRIRHLVVTDNARVLGVVSEHDLGGRSGAVIRRQRLVGDLMSSPVVSATPKTTLRRAASLMRARAIGCLPVMDRSRLVGIVTATDVLEELGRSSSRRPQGRSSIPDSRKRTPFPDRIPRAAKRGSARVNAPLVPTYIRPRGVELGPDDRAYIRRKLGRRLGKFAASIERVSVRLEDVNGPRGGIDHVCRIKVVLSGLPSVFYEEREASFQALVDGAIAGVERALRRRLQRRRMAPIKKRGRTSEVVAAV
jgi:CBS domain-containing protein/ribosome-associated translation inhibitor RaiA